MNQNARLLGDEITRCRPTPRKDPLDYDGVEDWWSTYKVDLACVRTLDLWRTFTKKWAAFLEPQTLGLYMTPQKVRDLARFVRDFHHERVLGDNKEFRRVLAPQVFVSIEMVRSYSREDPTQPPPPWGQVFEALCSLGYFKLDDGGVYLDTEMLGPDPTQKVVRGGAPETILRIQQKMLRDKNVATGKGVPYRGNATEIRRKADIMRHVLGVPRT